MFSPVIATMGDYTYIYMWIDSWQNTDLKSCLVNPICKGNHPWPKWCDGPFEIQSVLPRFNGGFDKLVFFNQQQCADSGYIRNLRIITHRIFWVRFWIQKHTMSSPFPNWVTYLATKQGSIYIQLRKTKKGCLVPRRVAPMWYRTQNMFCCTQYSAWSSLTTQHHYIYVIVVFPKPQKS